MPDDEAGREVRLTEIAVVSGCGGCGVVRLRRMGMRFGIAGWD